MKEPRPPTSLQGGSVVKHSCKILAASIAVVVGMVVTATRPRPPAHHMVMLVRYDDQTVCFMHNEDDPGTYHSMPTEEFRRLHNLDEHWWGVVCTPKEGHGPGLCDEDANRRCCGASGWRDPVAIVPETTSY